MVTIEDDDSYPDGVFVHRFFAAVDRATKVQAPAVEKYVERLRSKNSTKTDHELQEILDKRLVQITTATGAGNGGIAAFPGIGTLISASTLGGEAFAVLEVCALYALAAANIRGIDIRDEQQRKSIVLLTVAGSSGKDVISVISQAAGIRGMLNLRSLNTLSRRQVLDVNSALGRVALRQVRKKFGGAMLRKLLPFGVGAVLGGQANRKIAKQMIQQVKTTLGPVD